jgi:hypothetical protein
MPIREITALRLQANRDFGNASDFPDPSKIVLKADH